MATTRLLVLMLAGVLPLVVSTAEGGWVVVTLFYEAALVALAIMDYAFLPRRRDLSARRAAGGNLTQGIPRRVRVDVANESPRRARLTVKDTPPTEFDATDRVRTLVLAPMRRASVEYEALSYVRGEFAFGDIYIRALGRLRLAERQYRVEAAAPVEVLPDVNAISRQRLALELGSRFVFGRSRSRYIQAGTDFARLRDYTSGDDYRHISWKATARRNRLITREFEAERSQVVFIMLDAGRMMTTRIGRYSRMDYAVNAALQLAASCLAKGDLVGMLAFSSDIKGYLPPRKGHMQWRRVVDFVGGVQPDSSEPDYARAYAHFLARTKRRALAVTFTDLANLGSGGTMVKYNLLLIRRHLPLIVSIQDSDVAAEALIASRDSRSVYRRAVAAELVEEGEAILARLENAGVLTVHVPADRLSTATVNRYLEVKYRNLL